MTKIKKPFVTLIFTTTHTGHFIDGGILQKSNITREWFRAHTKDQVCAFGADTSIGRQAHMHQTGPIAIFMDKLPAAHMLRTSAHMPKFTNLENLISYYAAMGHDKISLFGGHDLCVSAMNAKYNDAPLIDKIIRTSVALDTKHHDKPLRHNLTQHMTSDSFNNDLHMCLTLHPGDTIYTQNCHVHNMRYDLSEYKLDRPITKYDHPFKFIVLRILSRVNQR